MISQRKFSDYYLFRRLKATSSATTYRAGRVQARAVDRVVLLHLFDRVPEAGDRFWDRVRGRCALHDILKDPRFGRGVELGVSEGVPFAAYDYVVGRSLDDILARARKRRMPLSVNQALAVLDQVATALVEAQELLFEGAPILHGALAPELIHLSHQGRITTFGFDTAPGMAILDPDSRYRSPELRGNATPTEADDVFSLAAILFEVLTGQPPAKSGSYAVQVDQALPVGDVAPLAPEVQDLLKHGLAGRAMRTPDVMRWRQQLRAAAAGEAGRASDFQLSFYLHALFREELESESREMQSEKAARWTIAAPSADDGDDADAREEPRERVPEVIGHETGEASGDDAAAAPEEAHAEPVRAAADEGSPETALSRGSQEEAQPVPAASESDRLEVAAAHTETAGPRQRGDRSPTPFFVGLAASLAVAAVATAAYFLSAPEAMRVSSANLRPETREDSQDVAARRLVASRAERLEKDLRAEFEPRLTRLREQLLDARRRAGASSPAPPTAADDRASARDLALSPQSVPVPVSVPAEARETAAAEIESIDASALDDPAPPAEAATMVASVETDDPSELPTERGEVAAIVESALEPGTGAGEAGPVNVGGNAIAPPRLGVAVGEPGLEAPPAPADEISQGPAQNRQEAQELSSSVLTGGTAPARSADPAAETLPPSASTTGGGPTTPGAPAATPARLLEPPQPRYPRVARRLGRTATVRLKVLVDEVGQPVRAELLSPPVGLGFEEAAERAVMASRWTPATTPDGNGISDWVVLNVEFRR